MEVVLVRYVGAGLALALSGLSSRVPRDLVGDGMRLVKHLSCDNPPAFRPLIETLARDLTRGWRTAHIPDPIVRQHLEALPSVLQAYGPSADDWQKIAAQLPEGEISRKVYGALAQNAAAETVASASAAGAIQRAALLVQVSVTLIQSLLESILAHAGDVRALLAAAERLSAPSPAHEKNALAEAIARLHCSDCPEELLSAIAADLQARGLSPDDIASHLETSADVCRELVKRIVSAPVRQTDAFISTSLTSALAQLKAGELTEASETLSRLEDAGPRAEDLDHNEGNPLGSEIRQMRAGLEEARGNFTDAAAHLAAARRFCSSYDLRGRWRLMMRQSALLARAGTDAGDIRLLSEAAQIHAEAGGLTQEQDAPLEWAAAHVQLGKLLLSLAEREHRPERYLAAALHFKPAVDVFSREGAMEDWALAQLGLAEALRGQGEHQGDPVILADAILAYRAALGMLHAGRSPAECRTARAGLGLAIVRLAEETGKGAHIDDAIGALKQALSEMQRSKAKRLEAALGRAYVVLAAENDDPAILHEAVERLSKALEPSPDGVAGREAAQLMRLLGSSLWAIGESGGDRVQLETALQTLRQAKQSFEGIGAGQAADAVGQEITTLEAIIVRTKRAQRHAANLERLKSGA